MEVILTFRKFVYQIDWQWNNILRCQKADISNFQRENSSGQAHLDGFHELGVGEIEAQLPEIILKIS